MYGGHTVDDLGYPKALVQTNNSSSRALMQPPSSHERGSDEDASAARARQGGNHQSNCAQDMSVCMTPNYLAALGPGGKQPPSQDTQKQLEKERCCGENR